MTNEAKRNEDTVEPLVRHIWVVALVLERIEAGSVTISQTISWRSCESQEEAVGQAVIFAAKDKPGFAVKMHTVAKIELPNNAVSGGAGAPYTPRAGSAAGAS